MSKAEPVPYDKDDWDKATAFGKGYLSYTYSEWPGSTIPKKNPFQVGSRDYADFNRGSDVAMLDAQDSEE